MFNRPEREMLFGIHGQSSIDLLVQTGAYASPRLVPLAPSFIPVLVFDFESGRLERVRRR